jgi:hypothetical protein
MKRLAFAAVFLSPVLFSAPTAFAKGGGCAETCALSEAPEVQSEAEFRASLNAWLATDMKSESLDLDTLLYYAGSTAHFLAALGELDLDPVRGAFLQSELARTQVTMEMRLVDDSGAIRGTVLAAGIPLGEKQHLRFRSTGSLGHLESGGRVRRVGLNHIWSRW